MPVVCAGLGSRPLFSVTFRLHLEKSGRGVAICNTLLFPRGVQSVTQSPVNVSTSALVSTHGDGGVCVWLAACCCTSMYIGLCHIGSQSSVMLGVWH